MADTGGMQWLEWVGQPHNGCTFGYSPEKLARRQQDSTLLEESYGMVYLAKYRGAVGLKVIDVRSIESVVAMIPDIHTPRGPTTPQLIEEKEYFLAERMGMGVMQLAGHMLDNPHADGN